MGEFTEVEVLGAGEPLTAKITRLEAERGKVTAELQRVEAELREVKAAIVGQKPRDIPFVLAKRDRLVAKRQDLVDRSMALKQQLRPLHDQREAARLADHAVVGAEFEGMSPQELADVLRAQERVVNRMKAAFDREVATLHYLNKKLNPDAEWTPPEEPGPRRPIEDLSVRLPKPIPHGVVPTLYEASKPLGYVSGFHTGPGPHFPWHPTRHIYSKTAK